MDTTYLKTTDKTKLIKKALVEEFGKGNVRVHRDRGTAAHWINSTVFIKHVCNDEQCRATSYATNQDCMDAVKVAHRKAEQIARDALTAAGGRMSTFSSDDGYGTDLDCHIVNVYLYK